MKFRVALPASSLYPGGVDHWWKDAPWSEMVRIAQAADELGFDAIHVSEHIAMHEDLVDTMGPRWVHTVTTLGFLAGATRNIKVVGLIVVPYHHPVELAKAYATLDVASEGRAVMAAAVGYMEWEYELMNAPPFAERGAVTDEYMQAMIELWTAERPRFEGKYVRFSDIVFDPKPYRRPHPTIWFAGNSKAAVRRAARYADGWYPNAMSRARLAEQLVYLREQPGFADRTEPFDVFLNLFEREMDLNSHQVRQPPKVVFEKDAILEQVQQLAQLGVTMTEADSILSGGTGAHGDTGLRPVRSADEFVERLHWFAEEIFPEGRTL
jgi:probable F420-dependent oxidoreductase